jgi:mediator of RNA polymerase II transcription subunit 14
MNQNRQFDDVIHALTSSRDSLDGARYDASVTHPLICVLMDNRLRNHDLLTSLDVLTTGSYRRLPTIIKVWTYSLVQLAESLTMAIESHHTTSSPY